MRQLRRRYRELTVVVCAVGAGVAALLAGGPVSADGAIFDLLIAVRAAWFQAQDDPARSRVAVVAVDEGSLADPSLRPYPRVFLAPVWAEVLDGLVRAGARVVGFDILFTYSANDFAAVAPELKNFDAPFLAAVDAHRGRVVLGRSQTTLPSIQIVAALRGDESAFGLLEIESDPDGRYRRVPLWRVLEDGRPSPTLSGAVLLAAGGAARAREVLLAPRRHLETIPTFALADVLRCARTAPDALTRAFSGTAVLIGTTHPDEDRRISSDRFLPAPRASVSMHPCGLRRLPASAPDSGTIPGVFLHAEAVAEVLTGHVTWTATPWVIAALSATTGTAGATVGTLTAPWVATLAILGVAVVVAVGAAAALAHNVWIPLALPLAALVGTTVIAYVVRYLFEERRRRRLQNAFGHYVAPAVVARLLDDASALRLGGERRELTVMFADLSGFTALSGKVDPETLTAKTNEYLAYIVEQVDATGGYVDKFMGDAVMAVWGAPAPDPHHAANAVLAALAAADRIAAEHERARTRGVAGFSVKIGINSGPAVIGNVGTPRRYNYTAVGEIVNVASRLESVPTLYGCYVIVAERTAELARDDILFREIDTIRVKGREAPLTIFEPMGRRAAATAPDLHRVERYEAALASYRGGHFEDAAGEWAAMSAADDPPARMAERARGLATKPPDGPWDGVWVLLNK